MNWHHKIAVCVGVVLPTAAMAQATLVETAIAKLPDEIAGVTRVYNETSGKPLVVYSGRVGSEPLIAVAYAQVKQPEASQTLHDLARGAANDANILRTLFEGRFAIPDNPSATTFFGEYLTERGLRQVWLAEGGGLRTTISATIFRLEDRRKVFDEVRMRLLHGATMTEQLPVAANRKILQ